MNKLASWETLTGTTPTIESDRTLAVVSFPLRSAIQRMTETSSVVGNGADVSVNVGNGAEKVPVNAAEGKNIPVNSTVNSTVKLTDLQKSILNLMTEKAEITIDEISAAIVRDRNAVNYQLKKLRERGFIERVGSDKTGKWTVNIAP